MLIAVLMLFGISAVALVAISIINSGLAQRRAEGASGKAFYAAESGIEQALLVLKNYQQGRVPQLMTIVSCADNIGDKYLDFKIDANDTHNFSTLSNANCTQDQVIVSLDDSNQSPKPTYWVKVKTADANSFVSATVPNCSNYDRHITLNARGAYLGASRELEVTVCLPQCLTDNVNSGTCDGCGNACGSVGGSSN